MIHPWGPTYLISNTPRTRPAPRSKKQKKKKKRKREGEEDGGGKWAEASGGGEEGEEPLLEVSQSLSLDRTHTYPHKAGNQSVNRCSTPERGQAKPGSGRITSSGMIVTGYDTKFLSELKVHDAIIVQHPTT